MRQFFATITCVGKIIEVVEYRNLLDADGNPFVYYHQECEVCGDLIYRTEEVRLLEVIDLMNARLSIFVFEDTNTEIQNILNEQQREASHEARIAMLEHIENELRHNRRHLKFV